MMEIDIPGFKRLNLKYLVMDYNGTLAIDGKLINNIEEKLNELAKVVDIHIVTADTFHEALGKLGKIKCKVKILQGEDQNVQKSEYISGLGNKNVMAIGNGMNDTLMLKNAALGIAVIQQEGASMQALQSADIVCHSIYDALDLFENSLRMVATLRN